MQLSISHAVPEICVATAEIKADGTVYSASQQLCDLLQTSFNDISGRAFDEIFQSDHLEGDSELHAKVRSGAVQSYSSNRSANRKDGTRLSALVHFSSNNHDSGGPTNRLLATVVD